MNPDEDVEEQVETNVELSNEAQEDYAEDNSPSYEKPESLYGLFKETLVMEDSSKLGNLDSKELGMLDISVRDCQYIAETARELGEKDFAKWMDKQAQITLKTSASKRGWLTELFVTAKRFASKEKRLGIPGAEGVQPQQNKSFWEKVKGQ
jgi:hypothetical protein